MQSRKPIFNCRANQKYPLNSNFLQSNIIYKATVNTADNEKKNRKNYAKTKYCLSTIYEFHNFIKICMGI